MFICSRVQSVSDKEYKHYWLVRYDLHKGTIEAFDSFSAFGDHQPHDNQLEGFMKEVFHT